MPAKGYLNIRNLPAGDKPVKQVLKEFFKKNKKCPHCQGRGFTLDDKKVSVLPGATSVKYGDIEDLVEIDVAGQLTGDIIKKIVETEIFNRHECDKCNGFGFVPKKSRKKKDETS